MLFLHRLAMALCALTLLALQSGPRAARAAGAAGTPVDGIRCDQAEGAVFHIHQHLALFDQGKPIDVPSDVGRPPAAQCLYWLHTHTGDGIIHVESPVFRSFFLGQFFDVWGQPLTATNAAGVRAGKGAVHVFVNGSPYKGDPRKIELAQHTDIVIEVGPPYHKPAPFANWNGQ